MKKIITLAAALLIATAGAAFAQKQDAPKPAPATTVPATKADAKKEPMDINTASEKELTSLPWIGEVRAKAIVKGRPYSGKDDLIIKKIIPQDAYDAIRDVVIARQARKEEAMTFIGRRAKSAATCGPASFASESCKRLFLTTNSLQQAIHGQGRRNDNEHPHHVSGGHQRDAELQGAGGDRHIGDATRRGGQYHAGHKDAG